MNGGREAKGHHPAPHAEKLPTWQAYIMLFGGPAAWLSQLSANFMMASWPCFPTERRLGEPLTGYGWTHPASVVLLLFAALLATVTGYVSLRKLREVRGEERGGDAALAEIGHGRTRFLALWGVIFGFSAAATVFLEIVAYGLIPPCAA